VARSFTRRRAATNSERFPCFPERFPCCRNSAVYFPDDPADSIRPIDGGPGPAGAVHPGFAQTWAGTTTTLTLVREILDILRADAHATPERIATMTGLDATEVRRQVEAWERAGVIRRYKAVIDFDRMRELSDTEVITALIDVSVAPARGVGFDDVAARIARFAEVRSVYLVSGVQDLRCVVTGSSMHDIADFVAQKLSTIDRVTATATYFVLKIYKDDDELFVEQAADHRLRVAP
jgi:DNA-binding Lrp family transcriptional regulator